MYSQTLLEPMFEPFVSELKISLEFTRRNFNDGLSTIRSYERYDRFTPMEWFSVKRESGQRCYLSGAIFL